MLNEGGEISGQTETFTLEEITADMKQVFTLCLGLCAVFISSIVICDLPLTKYLSAQSVKYVDVHGKNKPGLKRTNRRKHWVCSAVIC